MNTDHEEYLFHRISALKNRVEFLEAQLEVSKQINFNNNRYEQGKTERTLQ